MGGFFGSSATSSGVSGLARLGPPLAYVSPAGGAVAAAPVGFTNQTGRLNVTLPGGSATWLTLAPPPNALDGQMVDVHNRDAANTLTLDVGGFGDLGVVMPPNNHQLIYWSAPSAKWETLTP